MRPGPDVSRQPQTRERRTALPSVSDAPRQTVVALSDEQLQLIDVLQRQRHGMTLRQLQSKLPHPRERIELLVESLQERQLVARLNTLVPSFVYIYDGVDLTVD